MAVKKRSFKGRKQFVVYKAEMRYHRNRQAKLMAHLKKFPNDEQARKALKSADVIPHRSRRSDGHIVKTMEAGITNMIRKMIRKGPTPMPISMREQMEALGF